ncbi:MAG: NAD-dependent epimerase/dehydratase family protein [Candidatus Omnitrophica bacterium]|nr:NAD-dependent epimerase/dehydratase family protein [Candidatus Omnitrophota bacterium]
MIDYFTNKTILITGSQGYLGTQIKSALASASCRIVAFDRKLPENSSDTGKAEIRYVQGDVQDPAIWDQLLDGVDIIFHLAAQTSSRAANENPLMDLQANVVPVLNLITACHRNNRFPDILFAGTATQVGLTESYPVNESWKDEPITIYDIHKLTVEQHLRFYAKNKGRAVTLRLANLYGPGPKSSNADRGILNWMVRQAIDQQPLMVYGDGSFVRDYIFVDDVVRAFLLAAVHMDQTTKQYFVLGTGEGHTFLEMVTCIQETVKRLLGYKVQVQTVPPPENLSPIEFRRFVADSSAFQNATGWKADVSLKEGIERTVEYFIKETAQ